MLWFKDATAGLGLIAFIAGSYALASALTAVALIH